jgi:FixJ family two-component response regulator
MNLLHTTQVRCRVSLPEVPTVFVVDADATTRETLDALVHGTGWLCRTATSAEEFLERPRAMTPCCLLADLDLPGLGGLALQRLVADRAELPVIFMSAGDDVLQSIREALDRSRTELRHIATMRALQSRYESLSRREREVMELVVSGRLNKQVGGELGISEITVKAHRGKLMRKMQARSFAELVKMAGNLGSADNYDSVLDSARAFTFAANDARGADSYGHA